MIARLFAALSFSILLVGGAAAGGEPSAAKRNERWIDPGWRRTVARYYVKFDERGLSTTTYEFEFQPLNDKGAAAIAQETFDYNSYFSDLAVSDLVTVKADGRMIPVDDRADPRSACLDRCVIALFRRGRVKTIAYSDVRPATGFAAA